MSNCDEDCLKNEACPQYRRRVRAGQPAPPIMLDLEDIEDDQAPLSDAIAGLAVLVIILIVGACAALVVGVL
jgi:hypothetical protein